MKITELKANRVFMAKMALLLLFIAVFTTCKNADSNKKAVLEPGNDSITATMDPSDPMYNAIENGVHLRTGFVDGDGLMAVVNNCTSCHSAKLVTQNRMTKEQWKATIRWMQEKQNLWDLGANEDTILNYLSTHYAPLIKGRRQNLTTPDWYVLEDKN